MTISRSGTPYWGTGGKVRPAIAAASGMIVWLTPFDAVTATGLARVLYLVALALLIVLTVSGLLLHLTAPKVGAGVAAWLVLSQISGRPVLGAAALAFVVMGGYEVGKIQRSSGRPWIFVLPLLVGAVLCLAQWVAHDNFYEEIFGAASRFAPGQGFRSHGTLGHPLPTAALLTALGIGVLIWIMQSSSPHRIRRSGVSLLFLAMVWLTTGTRSAPLLALIALVVAVATTPAAPLRRTLVRGLYCITHVGLAFVATLALAHFLAGGSGLSLPRVFSVTSLSTDRSYNSRADGARLTWEVLSTSPCGTVCSVAGHGHRSLEDRLARDRKLGYIAAVDNMYLTALYDFGVVPVGALVVLVIRVLRRPGNGEDVALERSVRMAVMILLLFGLIFDVFYWTGCAFALGVGLGLLSAKRRSVPEGHIGELAPRRHALWHSSAKGSHRAPAQAAALGTFLL